MAIQSERKNIFSEINITPLTDIFLVLLIIMMVVAPSFQSIDNTIEIPEINSGIAIEQKNAVISITANGDYYLNGNPINPTFLLSELKTIQPTLEKKEIVVKADSSIKSSLVMEVMRAAEAAEFEKLVIAGEPLSKKDAKALQENAQQNETTPQIFENNNDETDQTTRQPIGALPGDF